MSPIARFAFGLAFLSASIFLFGSIEKHGPFSEPVAAWVQALGTIGAIVGAVWLQDRQRQRDVDDRIRAARDAALALSMDVAAVMRLAGEMCREGEPLTRVNLTFLKRQLEGRARMLEGLDGSRLPGPVFDRLMEMLGGVHALLHLVEELLSIKRDTYSVTSERLDFYGLAAKKSANDIRAFYDLPTED